MATNRISSWIWLMAEESFTRCAADVGGVVLALRDVCDDLQVHPEPRARPRGLFDMARQVIAGAVMGAPTRADWRACALPTEKESQLTDAFKLRFKAFDFTVED